MAVSLKQRAIKGITWNLTERFGNNFIQFVLGVFLARLLAPEDYGLIGMVAVFFSVAGVFVQSGFGQAYVRKKEVSNDDANTVFYTNLVISILSYGALWVASPVIARFYAQPVLIKITRVMGIVVVINAFNVIQIAQINRAVDFKRKARITLIATFFSGIAGLTAAARGYGVWSLVICQMINRALLTLGFWFTSKWKPGWSFSRQSFHNMFSFGAWVLAANLIRTVFDNIYILTIGKFFPAAQLGYYTKAKQFQKIPSQQLAGAVGTVAFPIFSKLQGNKAQLKDGMSKFLSHTLAITVPLMTILIVTAEPFVFLLLSEKWAPMIPYFQLLCIVGVLYPIHAINVQVLQAQGKSNLNFRLAVLKNSLRIVNISVMYRWGVIFIIMGEVMVSFLALLINTYYTKKNIDYGIMDQIKDIRYIFLSATVAGGAGYAAIKVVTNQYVEILIGLLVTTVTYGILQYLFDKKFFMEIMRLRINIGKGKAQSR